jgi:hypothetical protein
MESTAPTNANGERLYGCDCCDRYVPESELHVVRGDPAGDVDFCNVCAEETCAYWEGR